jgi:hypothetical protein
LSWNFAGDDECSHPSLLDLEHYNMSHWDDIFRFTPLGLLSAVYNLTVLWMLSQFESQGTTFALQQLFHG